VNKKTNNETAVVVEVVVGVGGGGGGGGVGGCIGEGFKPITLKIRRVEVRDPVPAIVVFPETSNFTPPATFCWG